ncbi:serine proteinase [Vermiculatibacterium agrestimuris]|uniref:serine proteinase n=1 Tax=Vermiculatibacterium agrestimuris TaxID=2941519 RepID=UPI00203C1697|nr:serine proteinase [Vermiculatibacterium agrestimuris]
MALFDNLDSIKDRAIDLAQTGVAKSKQLAEIAKLKTANLGEEDAIRKAYIEIGKLYYAERGMAPEAAYEALCQKITAAKVNIEENKSRMEEIKSEGNIVDAETVSVEDAVVTPPVVESTAPVEPLAEDKKPEE